MATILFLGPVRACVRVRPANSQPKALVIPLAPALIAATSSSSLVLAVAVSNCMSQLIRCVRGTTADQQSPTTTLPARALVLLLSFVRA